MLKQYYLVDEFLMSDYEWWDWDTGHSDFWLAYGILTSVINDSALGNLLMAEDYKKRIRKWFLDHRNNYKFR